MVPFFAFRHLRAAGHRGIALIGGGTARIGDPSGKDEMRGLLDYDALDGNALAIRGQLEGFLGGFDGASTRCVNNRDWLAELNYIDFLRDVGRHFSVNRMLSFEAYKRRMETGLSFIEFNYQLLQSYDFLELFSRYGCRLQIGGDDQWGNIVAGMELIRRVAGSAAPAAFGLTFPLVTTSDGKKMGKTEKGAIFLDPALTTPYDFFQYWRNVADEDVLRFLLMFTFLPIEECRELASSRAAVNEAKGRLAWELTALIHGAALADEARAGAQAAFSGGAERGAMPTAVLRREVFARGYPAVDLFCDALLCASKSEARRLVEQGGAALVRDGVPRLVGSVGELVGLERFSDAGELVLRAGKKRFCRVLLED
jgi:tyrosyl-tRNA synthetase